MFRVWSCCGLTEGQSTLEQGLYAMSLGDLRSDGVVEEWDGEGIPAGLHTVLCSSGITGSPMYHVMGLSECMHLSCRLCSVGSRWSSPSAAG